MSVVKEIPVYLSKQAIHDLLLFEFPNRPKDNPLKPSSIIDCKYKPKAQCAELSLAVDTKSPNYERHRGQELGQLAPEQFPRGQFDRQLLRSMPKAGQQQQQQNRFVVARFHDNRLTLCPISSTARLVMQPVLEHLDSAAAKSSTEQQSNAGAAGDDADAARAVTLRFARQETPEARQRREQSYRVCQRLLEQEPWTGCQWLSVDEDQPLRSNDEFLLGVVNSNSENEPVAMDTREPVPKTGGEAREAGAMGSSGNSSELYLSRLCPPVSSVSSVDECAASVADCGRPSVSLARLKAMPCDERLRALFKSACVLRWTQLVDLLKQCGMSHAQLTESLTQIHGHLNELACLVHGQWVVKSEILYPPGTLSMYSGVPSEVLCRGRDYILCRFVQGRTVTRKEVASLVKMPSEEISQILSRISRIVRPTGDSGQQHHQHQHHQEPHRAPKMRLAFVLDEDTEYIRRNPDVVKKARYYWDVKWKLLSEQLKLDKASRHFRTASISDAAQHSGSGSSRRSRTRSARYSHCGGGGGDASSSDSSSTTSSRQSPSRGGGGSRGGGRQQRRLYSRRQCVSMCESVGGDEVDNNQQSNNSRSRSPSPRRRQQGQQGREFESSSGGGSELEQRIRAFLLTKLQDRMVAGLEELVRFYRAETASPDGGSGDAAAAAAASLPASDEACRRLFDSAAESAGLVIFQGGSGCRLYAYSPQSSGSSQLDSQPPHARHRQELLAALKAGNAQVTLAQLRARFDAAQLEPLPESTLKSLVKDYCVFRGKAYYAKGYQH
ncbi:hypothetical protein BOX15_Mlig004084g1 [Macrostomum lignano]|uniref:DNA-directed RNA polymerase III subunit RPC5 n=2 Tax=Macrostomum lignano TaxID=282301 RepID=A0A267GQN6_9PLAT|nr:hypothetical protein BOX15_Mlig004084g1 [Macrostomum lignano]